MESTSRYNDSMDVTDDSGFRTQTTFENSSSQFHFTSDYNSLSLTTDSQNNTSQMQKNSFDLTISPQLRDNCNFPSISNETLPECFRKFALNSTPNYYVERPEFLTKPIEQSTPTKYLYEKLKTNSNTKLGSPEFAEILYPQIKHFQRSHTKSPQKNFKRYKTDSPVKKRLFLDKPEKVDPVTFFRNHRRNYSNILTKLMLFLTESDLCTFKLVSSRWRDALLACKVNSMRYYAYVKSFKFNKENYCNDFGNSMEKCYEEEEAKAANLSNMKENFDTFLRVAQTLKRKQSLNKCQKCQYAAIVENNISQCQKPSCEYITCLNCGSFSVSGPENFHDSCQSSYLVYEKPKVVRRLSDSPPTTIDPNSPPFFLKDATNNNVDFKPELNTSDVQFNELRTRSVSAEVLKQCNRKLFSNVPVVRRKSSVATVVPCHKKSVINIIEPSSPPKVSEIAGSRESKKRLKRLLK